MLTILFYSLTELYYLISRFLTTGPCQSAAEVNWRALLTSFFLLFKIVGEKLMKATHSKNLFFVSIADSSERTRRISGVYSGSSGVLPSVYVATSYPDWTGT